MWSQVKEDPAVLVTPARGGLWREHSPADLELGTYISDILGTKLAVIVIYTTGRAQR